MLRPPYSHSPKGNVGQHVLTTPIDIAGKSYQNDVQSDRYRDRQSHLLTCNYTQCFPVHSTTPADGFVEQPRNGSFLIRWSVIRSNKSLLSTKGLYTEGQNVGKPTPYLPASYAALAIGDISVASIKNPSLARSGEGLTTSAETWAATLKTR